MGKAIPVTLSNGRHWRISGDAIAYFKAMLGRYQNGQTIDAADAADLAALLVRYDQCLNPGEPTKAGTGVSYFSRELNVGDLYATPGFHVHRTDGTSVDFSFYHAVKSSPTV